MTGGPLRPGYRQGREMGDNFTAARHPARAAQFTV